MSKRSITKKYIINGPVNIIRLTNNKKVVYIFGDLHNNLDNQSECNYDANIESINIDQLFRKIFKKNPNTKYDFFYEGFFDVEPIIDKNQQNNFRYDYNYKTNKYFIQILKLVFNNIELVDNKIHTSKQFENVRLHYFNFRNQIPHMKYIFFNDTNFLQLKTSTNYNNTIGILEDYKLMMNELQTFILSDKNPYIVKIKSRYQNKDIQDIILQIFDKNVVKLIENVLKLITDTIYYIKNTPELYNSYLLLEDEYDIQKKIFINVFLINYYIKNIYSNIIDIYLVRRLLDKEYINNTIIYTGAYHMIHITYILLKYFNFEISHITNTDLSVKDKDINKLIKSKNINKYDDIYFLEKYLWNNTLQCSNLFNFPDNLE